MKRKLYLYWVTLRYLKPGQLIGRVRFRLKRVSSDLRPAPALAGLNPKVRFP